MFFRCNLEYRRYLHLLIEDMYSKAFFFFFLTKRIPPHIFSVFFVFSPTLRHKWGTTYGFSWVSAAQPVKELWQWWDCTQIRDETMQLSVSISIYTSYKSSFPLYVSPKKWVCRSVCIHIYKWYPSRSKSSKIILSSGKAELLWVVH